MLRNLTKKIVLAGMAALFCACKTKKSESLTEIILTNNSELELSDKAVSIERSQLPEIDSVSYPLLISNTDTIPSQLNDLDGDGEWDELFFVVDFSAHEEKSLQLQWKEKVPDYPIKTSVRFGKRETKEERVQPAEKEIVLATDVPKNLGFQKYQTDGPTWENDKIGFRHYLDGRNAKDVFGKKKVSISPEQVGINEEGAVEDNYHVMEDWGRDIFPVGNSVGLGGFALLIDDEVKRIGITVNDTINNVEKTTFAIVEEGPVKSILKYEYENWEASENSYDIKETTTIWPGMYGFKNEVRINGLQGKETFLIGLSNINNKNHLQEVEIGDKIALIAHDYQTYNREWLLGTALIFPKGRYEGYMEAPQEGQLTDSYLAKIRMDNKKTIEYYAIAAWEMGIDPNFKDADYFKDYVINLAQQLAATIDVHINTENNNL